MNTITHLLYSTIRRFQINANLYDQLSMSVDQYVDKLLWGSLSNANTVFNYKAHMKQITRHDEIR